MNVEGKNLVTYLEEEKKDNCLKPLKEGEGKDVQGLPVEKKKGTLLMAYRITRN